VLLAELEIFHSRSYSPTRRVALGATQLPCDPTPGFGGILLGGVVAAHAGDIDPELIGEVYRLVRDVEIGGRIVQPRVRHRFQVDTVGLARSHHRLYSRGEHVEFALETSGTALQQVLGAVYAVLAQPRPLRPALAGTIHAALRWNGPLGPSFVAHLSGARGARAFSVTSLADPSAWARIVLGFDPDASSPPKKEVQARFRALLREAHPDHGGDAGDAGDRIQELAEARRILLGV